MKHLPLHRPKLKIKQWHLEMSVIHSTTMLVTQNIH